MSILPNHTGSPMVFALLLRCHSRCSVSKVGGDGVKAEAEAEVEVREETAGYPDAKEGARGVAGVGVWHEKRNCEGRAVNLMYVLRYTK